MAVQDDIIQNIVLGGVQDVVSGFQSIQRAGEAAFNAIASSAAGSTSAIGAVGTVVAGAAAAIGVLSVGMFAWVKSSSQGIIAMGNFAEETSTSIEDLSTFSNALSRVGSDTGNLTNAIRRLAVRVETDWGIIKKSVSEAANVMQRDMLNVVSAQHNLEASDRALARSQEAADIERKHAAVSVKEAILNLRAAKFARDGATAADLRQLDVDRRRAAVDQARLQLREARFRKETQADEEQAKIEQAAIDRETKLLQLNEARQKQSEDQKNSIIELKKFTDDVASGAEADFSRVNLTTDNLIRGIIASVGLAGNSLEEFKGSIHDAAGAGPELFAVMEKMSDVFHNLKDPTLVTATAVAAFGRGVDPTFIHALTQGSEHLRELRQRMKDLGLVIDDTQLAIARDFRGALGRLRTDVDIISKQFANQFAPSFTKVLDALSTGFEGARPAIIEFGAGIANAIQPAVESLIRVLQGIPDQVQDKWILDLISNLVGLGTAFTTAGSIIVGAVGLIVDALNLLAGAINLVFGTNLTAGALAGWAAGFIIVSSAVRLLIGALFALIAPLAAAATGTGVLATALTSVLLPAILGVAAGWFLAIKAMQVFESATFRRDFNAATKDMKAGMIAAGVSAEDAEAQMNALADTMEKTLPGATDVMKQQLEELKQLFKDFTAPLRQSADDAATANDEAAKKTVEAWQKAGAEAAKKFEENIKKGADKAALDQINAARTAQSALQAILGQSGATARSAARDEEGIQVKRVADTQIYFDALKKLIQARQELADLEKSAGEAGNKEAIEAKKAEINQLERLVRRARENLGTIADSIRDLASKGSSDSVRNVDKTKNATRQLRSEMELKNRVLQQQNTLEKDNSGTKTTEQKTDATKELSDTTNRLANDFEKGSVKIQKLTEQEKEDLKNMIEELKKGSASALKVLVDNTDATAAEFDHVLKILEQILKQGFKRISEAVSRASIVEKDPLDSEVETIRKSNEGLKKALEVRKKAREQQERDDADFAAAQEKQRQDELQNQKNTAQSAEEIEKKRAADAAAAAATKKAADDAEAKSTADKAAAEAAAAAAAKKAADDTAAAEAAANKKIQDIIQDTIDKIEKEKETLEQPIPIPTPRPPGALPADSPLLDPDANRAAADSIEMISRATQDAQVELVALKSTGADSAQGLTDAFKGVPKEVEDAFKQFDFDALRIETFAGKIQNAQGVRDALEKMGFSPEEIDLQMENVRKHIEEGQKKIEEQFKKTIPVDELDLMDFDKLRKQFQIPEDAELLIRTKLEGADDVKKELDDVANAAKDAASKAEDAFKGIDIKPDTDVDFSPVVSSAESAASDVESTFQNIRPEITIPPPVVPQVDFSPIIFAASSAGSQAGSALSSSLQSSVTTIDFSGIISSIQAVIDSFSVVSTAAQQAQSAIQNIGTADFASGITSQASQAESALSGLVTAAEMASQAIDAIDTSAGSGSSSTGFESVPGVARGGLFRGRSGIDQNIIRVSDFEYIMRPEAVRKYGIHLMDLINSLQFNGYRAGGLIRIPGFAMGGSTGGGGSTRQQSRAINLTIGGQTFKGLTAPEETAKQLERAAVNRQYRTTGAKPTWVR